MPNRVLRDTTDSEAVNALSAAAEVFFYRLMMKADDFGYFHANNKLLKAALYPLRDEMSLDEIDSLLAECELKNDDGEQLVYTYMVSGKKYLRINNFGQRKRIMKSSFPEPKDAPPSNDSGLPTDDSGLRPEKKRIETEKEREIEIERQNILEFFFNDLPNSSELERISKAINVDQETLRAAIPDFKSAANLSYQNMTKFAEHFKNWYLIKKAKPPGSKLDAVISNDQIQEQRLKEKYGKK